MRIATYNVNSIKQRIEPMQRWLKERAPDIVCLQEIKCVDEAFPRGAFEDLGYNVAVHGRRAITASRCFPNFRSTKSRRVFPAATVTCTRAISKR